MFYSQSILVKMFIVCGSKSLCLIFGAINCLHFNIFRIFKLNFLGESNVIWISEVSVFFLPGIPQNLTFHAENWTAPRRKALFKPSHEKSNAVMPSTGFSQEFFNAFGKVEL